MLLGIHCFKLKYFSFCTPFVLERPSCLPVVWGHLVHHSLSDDESYPETSFKRRHSKGLALAWTDTHFKIPLLFSIIISNCSFLKSEDIWHIMKTDILIINVNFCSVLIHIYRKPLKANISIHSHESIFEAWEAFVCSVISSLLITPKWIWHKCQTLMIWLSAPCMYSPLSAWCFRTASTVRIMKRPFSSSWIFHRLIDDNTAWASKPHVGKLRDCGRMLHCTPIRRGNVKHMRCEKRAIAVWGQVRVKKIRFDCSNTLKIETEGLSLF